MAKNRPPAPEPLTRERVLEALRKAGGSAQKRDIARELGIGPDQKKELRRILRELEEDGALGRTGRKRYADAQRAAAESGVMDIVDRDHDGELLARMRGPGRLVRPARAPRARRSARHAKAKPAVGVGDRVLARITSTEDGPEARVVKRLGQSAHQDPRRLSAPAKDDRGARFGGGRVEPADRKARHDLIDRCREHVGDAKDGDLVLVELAAQRAARARAQARHRSRKSSASENDPRAASILAMHTHGITRGLHAGGRARKPKRREARDAQGPHRSAQTAADHHRPRRRARSRRRRLRASPTTIRRTRAAGASGSPSPTSPHYVTPGSALDRGACKRGNSTYFPDRVAPMLPEIALGRSLLAARERRPRLPCRRNGVRHARARSAATNSRAA